jgi:hypothetical protein
MRRSPAEFERRLTEAARFEKLALYWVKQGDLYRAALARRTARLQRQTAQLELHEQHENS